jgi:single-strand DNA-binding protein
MTDTIILTGLVATVPRHLVTGEGLPITSFRLASSQRRFDRAQQKWVDGDTNWYTITTFRQLAINAAGSVSKGDRVVVTGRLRIRDWEAGERAGTTVDIEADALGHDLTWGSTSFSRSIVSSSPAAQPEEFPAAVATGGPAPDGAAHVDPEPTDGQRADSDEREVAATPF